MARKLPWSADGSSTTPKVPARSARSVEPKREKKDVVPRPSTPEIKPERSRRIKSFRSPSTSPIRPPEQTIPDVELMHEGIHADDRYMMVEDEFETIAKQFTAHLHAAEYERLKRKAREAPPRTLPALNPEMSETTKLTLKRKHLLSRQNTALSDFGKRVGGTQVDSDNDENEDETVEEAKVNDPWSGTSLAGLMGEGSQAKTSLMGLDRISHATRAARGFGRGDKDPEKVKKSLRDIFEEANRGREDSASPDPQYRQSEKRSDERRKTHGPAQIQVDKQEFPKPSPPSKTPMSTSTSHRTTATSIPKPQLPTPTGRTSKPVIKRSWIDDLDDFDNIQPPSAAATVSKDKPRGSGASRHSPKKQDVKDAKDVKKDRRSRLDEVPVFMM